MLTVRATQFFEPCGRSLPLDFGALLALGLMGWASLPVTIGGLLVANAFLGLVIPTAIVMALDEHGAIAGLASSLGGTLQMLVGGVIVLLSGPFFDGSVVPMLAAIALCGAMALLLSRVVQPTTAN